MLYEVAVLLEPTDAERDEGKLEEIIVKPSFIIAPNEQSASMQIILEAQKRFESVAKERLKVLVRPF
jgi:hypothetical protein